MGDKCIFCSKLLDVDDTVLVKRGLNRILSKSVSLNDEISEKIGSKDEIRVHKKCRKDYTRLEATFVNTHGKIDLPTKEQPLLRSNASTEFDFKNQCLFSDEKADICAEKKDLNADDEKFK